MAIETHPISLEVKKSFMESNLHNTFVHDKTLNQKNVYSRWACNLETLLDDSEGVEYFNIFLKIKYAVGHLLDFWFACKGYRSNVDLTNPEKLFQVAKVIYRTYIKSGAPYSVPLPIILKQNINFSLFYGCNNHNVCIPDRSLFDTAQDNIKSLLEKDFYPEFLNFIKCSNNLSYLSAQLLFENTYNQANVSSFKYPLVADILETPNSAFRKLAFCHRSKQFSANE